MNRKEGKGEKAKLGWGFKRSLQNRNSLYEAAAEMGTESSKGPRKGEQGMGRKIQGAGQKLQGHSGEAGEGWGRVDHAQNEDKCSFHTQPHCSQS